MSVSNASPTASPTVAIGPTTQLPHLTVSANESSPLLRHNRSVSSLADPVHERRREFLGLVLMALSAVGFSVMALLVKISGEIFPSLEIVFARSVIQLVLGLISCAFLHINPLGVSGVRNWLLLRGLAGAIGLALFFYSLTKLPLADATVIFFLGPMFTAILAYFALGEPFTLFDALCGIVSFVGVILVAKPHFLFSDVNYFQFFYGDPAPSDPSSSVRFLAVLAALLGAATSAIAYVTVRKIGRRAHFMVHVVYFGAVSAVLSFIALYFLQDVVMPQERNDWYLLVAVGGFAFLGQCLLNRGLQLAPAGPATIMRINDVAFAFILQVVVLHEPPEFFSVVGGLLIMSCTTAFGYHKWKASAREVRVPRERNRGHGGEDGRVRRGK